MAKVHLPAYFLTEDHYLSFTSKLVFYTSLNAAPPPVISMQMNKKFIHRMLKSCALSFSLLI